MTGFGQQPAQVFSDSISRRASTILPRPLDKGAYIGWNRECPNLENGFQDFDSLPTRLSFEVEKVECNSEATHHNEVHPGYPGQIPEEQAQEDDYQSQDIGNALHLSHDLHIVP